LKCIAFLHLRGISRSRKDTARRHRGQNQTTQSRRQSRCRQAPEAGHRTTFMARKTTSKLLCDIISTYRYGSRTPVNTATTVSTGGKNTGAGEGGGVGQGTGETRREGKEPPQQGGEQTIDTAEGC